MKKVVLSIALVVLILACFYLLSGATKNQVVLVAVLVLCGVCLLKLHWKKKAQQDTSIHKSAQGHAVIPTSSPKVETPIVHIEPTPAQNCNSIKLTIVGVTFQGRQTYLRKISEYEEPFVGCMFDVNKTEYKGETAFEVVALLDDGKEKVLGNIAKKDIAKVEEIYDSITSVDVNVYGGPEYDEDDKNYGASVELFYT